MSDLAEKVLAIAALTWLERRQHLNSARAVADDGNGLARVVKVLGPAGCVYQGPLKRIEPLDVRPPPVAVFESQYASWTFVITPPAIAYFKMPVPSTKKVA